jgi:ABC-type transport system involved in cytochrome c biogenesis permease subunit
MSSKIFFPMFVVSAAALYLTAVFLPPADAYGEMELQKFASLPVQESGRIMPFDTFARIRLLVLGHKEWVADIQMNEKGEAIRDENGEIVQGKPMSQVAWALDTIVHKPATNERRFIRIDNDQLLAWLKLDPNRHGLRYSLMEFANNKELLQEAKRIAEEGTVNKNDLKDVKIAELNEKFGTVMRIVGLDDPHLIPPSAAARGKQSLRDVPWLSIGRAFEDESADPKALEHVRTILSAYHGGKVTEFNRGVDAYRDYLNTLDPTLLFPTRVETLSNHFAPFYQCCILFGFVFLMACMSWTFWSEPLANAALALGIFTVLVYTVALGVRIWISGYAPVTNLYSSAIFIGWGAAILCLGLEGLLRNGIGSVLAAVTGFLALIVAINLVDGDTMGKLVAVLESNFWLSTHVTCVTFGYMATFVAGFLGIAYVLLGVFTDKLRGETGVQLVKVTYGVICFATLLSFVGTVLGGIWADQSWGRFWGWDPKENGALLIVVWNAIILHSRWGGIVKSRGVALLAIGGNIVTSWSWFGVNLLGIGLHNYGFMKGVMTVLFVWAVANLAIIAIGMIPQRNWASFAPRNAEPPRPSGPLPRPVMPTQVAGMA